MSSISSKDIEKVVNETVKTLLEIEGSISLNDDLNQRGMDSLKSIRMIVELETTFNIEFNDDELMFENFSTVRKITNRVANKISLESEVFYKKQV